jgi:phthalate 4,5-dioxygenase oxygenase subunit
VQDGACQSGIRPIFDRSKEHLGSSDTGIVMTRRLLLEAVSAYRDRGIQPSGVTDPDIFMVRAVSLTLPETTSWADFGRPHMTARLGADFGYAL